MSNTPAQDGYSTTTQPHPVSGFPLASLMAFDPILRSEQLRALEAIFYDCNLMERAGAAAAADALALLGGQHLPVLLLAGPGNNGGDAFVAARLLLEQGYPAEVVFIGDPARLPTDAQAAYRRWQAVAKVPAHTELPPPGPWGLVIDGLFGVGLTRPISGPYAAWIDTVNQWNVPILALDLPSGVQGDTGQSLGSTIKATQTSTFIALKPGLLTGDGPDYCGSIRLHPLQLQWSPTGRDGRAVSWETVRSYRPQRYRTGHKGTHGTACIMGGAPGMVGAALLAGRSALLSGAGKVRLGLLGPTTVEVDFDYPELMIAEATDLARRFDSFDSLVVGPGLGQGQVQEALLRLCLPAPVPIVADADALNLIARYGHLRDVLRQRPTAAILTPHPGEAARLLGVPIATVQSDRVRHAQQLAEELNAIVVLKGAGTVIAAPGGHWYINDTANAALGTAGSGDVLAGLIGALLAQGVPPLHATLLGVSLHGTAADRLTAAGVGPIGLRAGELPAEVRHLLNSAPAETPRQ